MSETFETVAEAFGIQIPLSIDMGELSRGSQGIDKKIVNILAWSPLGKQCVVEVIEQF